MHVFVLDRVVVEAWRNRSACSTPPTAGSVSKQSKPSAKLYTLSLSIIEPAVATATKQYPPPTSHESDFYTWALESADAIRQGRFDGVDWDAVADELEDMGRSERRALENRFEVMLAHLIKWRFQHEHRSTSWTGTIKEQRRKAARLLRQNPGLKSLFPELISDAYESARALAERDTGIDEANFPPSCPWTVEQILDEDYWPELD
jgi:hypothetical protein